MFGGNSKQKKITSGDIQLFLEGELPKAPVVRRTVPLLSCQFASKRLGQFMAPCGDTLSTTTLQHLTPCSKKEQFSNHTEPGGTSSCDLSTIEFHLRRKSPLQPRADGLALWALSGDWTGTLVPARLLPIYPVCRIWSLFRSDWAKSILVPVYFSFSKEEAHS